jgi:hypothetical protein
LKRIDADARPFEGCELIRLHGGDQTFVWRDVHDELETVRHGRGSVQLEVGGGERMLQVFAERGRFVVLLGLETEGDWQVRTLSNSEEGLIEICGDKWDARSTTRDFDLVVRCFAVFFSTGDVPTTILN